MSWSKIWDEDHLWYQAVKANMGGLPYHNVNHVTNLYKWYGENNVPYNYDLDVATAFHDSVYDDKVNKEYRSVAFMLRVTDATVSDKAVMGIMATETHLLPEKFDPVTVPIIMADVHRLGLGFTRIADFYSIMEESTRLYGITEQEAARGSLEFMLNFLNTVRINATRKYEEVPDSSNFWNNIEAGVKAIIREAAINL